MEDNIKPVKFRWDELQVVKSVPGHGVGSWPSWGVNYFCTTVYTVLSLLRHLTNLGSRRGGYFK